MLCSRLLSMATGALAPAPLLPSLATRVAVTGVRSVPSTSNWFNFDTTESPVPMELLNRNARRPKKANHGKRPCSHFRRRQKRLGAKKA